MTRTLGAACPLSNSLALPSTRMRAPQAHALPDIYETRPEVVGYAKRRRTLLPFVHKLEITHPSTRVAAGDKNVIVIDLDELGTTGSATGSAGGASVGQLVFLSGLTVLAFYGTYTSICALIESTQELEELGVDRATLVDAMKAAREQNGSNAGRDAAVQMLKRMLAENRDMRVKTHVDRTFMGGFGGLGATLVGTSILTNAKMLGVFSPALASAAAPLMFAATPLVTIFGTGVASYQAYRIAKTFQVSGKAKQVLGTPLVGNESAALTLLEQRLKAQRWVYGVKAGAYLGLAMGVPMAVFGGPYGLPVLVTSAATMVGVGVLEGALTGYQPQLSLDDKMALRDTHDIVNDLTQAHAQRTTLKTLRCQKHLQFPHGGKAVAAVVRTLSKKKAAPAQASVMQIMREFATFEEQRANNNLRAAQVRRDAFLEKAIDDPAEQALRTAELDDAVTKDDVALRDVQFENDVMLQELNAAPGAEGAAFLLLQFLLKRDAFASFATELLKHKSLRREFSTHGIITEDAGEYHFDANKLVLYLSEDTSTHAKALLQHTFEVAQKVLLLGESKRALWRERQLLDVLAQQITTR